MKWKRIWKDYDAELEEIEQEEGCMYEGIRRQLIEDLIEEESERFIRG